MTLKAGISEVMVTLSAVTNATYYYVQWRTQDQNFGETSQQRWTSAGTHTVKNLANGVKHWFRACAGGGGTCIYSDEVGPATPSIVAVAPTAAPTEVEAMPGDGSSMVSWKPVAAKAPSSGAASHYTIQWKSPAQNYPTAPAAQATTAATTRQETIKVDPASTARVSYEIPGLDNGTEYTVRIRAENAAGKAAVWSNEVKVTPMMPTPALPVFGALALGAGLVAAGRRRLRAAQRRRLLKA